MEKRNFDLLFKKEIENIKDTRPSLLLHVCCGPCSSHVLKDLCSLFDITILYANSNIFPQEEYQRRYQELLDFIKCFNNDFKQNIQVIEKPYQPLEFMNHLHPLKEEKEGGKRCYLCYSLRMEETYRYALSNHFAYWTTVLSVSPHKNSQWINQIGESKPQDKTRFLYADFKKNDGYKKSVSMASQYGLYRQNYCGCLFSYTDMLKKVPKED